MTLNKDTHVLVSLATGGLLVIGLLLLLYATSEVAWADPGTLFAATTGADTACTQADPCLLQSALAQAQGGDTIYVAEGTYTGTGGAVITITRSVTLYGGWDSTSTAPPARDPDVHPTTLDGEGTRQVVNISGNVSPTIDGFVVTGGLAPDGGGVYIYDASPIIQGNVITANRTTSGGVYDDGRGGGIWVGGASNAIIIHNRILSNTSGYGGGIYHHGSTVITITANEIAGNVSSYRGGGYMVERTPDIVRVNVISGSIAGSDGGGILIWAAAPQVEANRIAGNSAHHGGGISMGNNATPSLLNNILISNTRDGLYAASSSPVVVNNTIVGSELADSRAGIRLWSSSGCTPPYCTEGSITNNIIISYEIGIFGTGPITAAIDYSDVWGNTTADYSVPASVMTGTHNISLDPLFANRAADDYHLQSGSPCIDAGDPAGVPPAPPTDIDGDWRPSADRVDIGADEHVIYRHIYLPLVPKSHSP